MFKSKTVTKHHRAKRLFEWELDCTSYMTKHTRSETMTAIGFGGIKYTGVFNIYKPDTYGCRPFDIDITPQPQEIQYFFQASSGSSSADGQKFKCYGKTVKLWVDVMTTVSTTTTTPALEYQEPKKTAFEDLKEMWKNDSSSQFTIKCGDQDITAIRPIMCARSVVFKKMFETNMKEKAQNRVVIQDFTPQIVQKMVEFCENDAIVDTKKCEEDLFKIAHKYEMESMKDFAIIAMAKSATAGNIASRLQLAQLYELKDFEKWCKNFASV